MSKILALAETGFGKTTSIIPTPRLNIKGLDPAITYIISITSKELPGHGTKKMYPILHNFSKATTAINLKDYRRIITNNAELVAHAINLLGTVKAIKNIVVDDGNYIMQDYYMEKALSTGWDAPKKIGYLMGKIFTAIEQLPDDKTFIMMAHGEEYEKADGRKGYRFKTTGKAVQEYITPEGKFDIVIIGRSRYDDTEKKAIKEYVVEDDGTYSSAKSHGAFETLYIPNDMGFVVERVNAYYEGN